MIKMTAHTVILMPRKERSQEKDNIITDKRILIFKKKKLIMKTFMSREKNTLTFHSC